MKQQVLVILAACAGVVFAEHASAQTFGFRHNGAECKNYFGVSASSFDVVGPRLYRRTSDGGSVKWAICPIEQPKDPSPTLATMAFDVWVTRAAGTITCFVRGYSNFGVENVAYFDSESVSSGTNYGLALDSPLDPDVVYVLYCALPEGAYINSFEYWAY